MPRRLIALSLLTVAVSCPLPAADGQAMTAATATATASSLLTPAERAGIDALAEALVAAGVPETRGSTVVLGKIVVSEPAPAVVQEHVARMWSSSREETKDGQLIRTFDGAHLLLADGRWLFNLCEPYTAKPGRSIVPDEAAKRIPPSALLGELTGRPNRGRSMDMRWISVFTPDERVRLEAIANQTVPLRSLEGPWAMGINLLMLHRAGVPGADAMLLMTGLGQVWPSKVEWGDVAPPIQLLDGDNLWSRWQRLARGGAEPDREQWLREHAGAFAIPDPQPALRRQISRWFRNQLLDPEFMAAFGLDAPRAMAQTLAFLPEERRAAATVDLDLLVARTALPRQAPTDADLATRLQSWTPGRVSDQNEPEITEEMIARMPTESQAHMRKRLEDRRAWKPADSDIPALLALLTDARPSRWMDNQTPRTVGDNALRALARLVRFDPRLLVGRDPATPWTDAERTASAEALRSWWTSLGDKPLVDGLISAIDTLPIAATARLIASRPADTRQALLDRVAASWQSKPQSTVPAEDLAQFLVTAGDNAAVTAQVAGWPMIGAQRPLLAVWNDRHGRPAELDKLLDELTANGNASDQAAGQLTAALRHAMRGPSAQRLQRCLTLAAGALDDRRTWCVLRAIGNTGNGYSTPEWAAAERLNQGDGNVTRRSEDGDAVDIGQAMPVIVACVMLADVRPLPETGLALEQHGNYGQLIIAGSSFGIQIGQDVEQDKPAADKATPKGLRVRDLSTLAVQSMIWRFGLHDLGDMSLDPWAATETRDTMINRLNDALLARARGAVVQYKLPDVLPAPKPADGDKSLF